MASKKNFIKTVAFSATVFFCFQAYSQDDSMSLLDDVPEPVEKIQNSFKTTKVINLQSLEVTDAGVFDFKINHRFGPVNSGAYDAYGLDGAITRIGGEYGVIPNLMIGLGRSSYQKTSDAYFKWRFMHQNSNNSRPFTALLFGSISNRNMKFSYPITATERLAFVTQLIIGRKFSDAFSLQISPTIVHYNIAPSDIPNTQYAVGIALRQKLSVRTSLNLEYIPVISNKGTFHNSVSFGFDIETGGHVFQLHFTNSAGNNEASYIARTDGTWNTAGFRFGFNISRVFTIVDPSKFKNNSY